MEVKDISVLLMRLMKAMGLSERFIAEVVVFLHKEEEQAAMILYLRDNSKATENQIRDIATGIMKASRS